MSFQRRRGWVLIGCAAVVAMALTTARGDTVPSGTLPTDRGGTWATDTSATAAGAVDGWVNDWQFYGWLCPVGAWDFDYKHWFHGGLPPAAWASFASVAKPPAPPAPGWLPFPGATVPGPGLMWTTTTPCGFGCTATSDWQLQYWQGALGWFRADKWTRSRALAAAHPQGVADSMTRITDPFVFDQPGGPEEGWSIMARVGFSGEMQAPVDGTFSGLELLFELSLDDGPRQETMHLNAGVGDEYGVSLTYAPFVHFARNGVEIPAQEILAEVSSYYLSEHEWSQPTPVGLEFDQGLAFDVVCYLDDTVSSAALYTTDITRAHDAIPEPATLWLLALGAVASRGFRRR